jgi:hypothetical protein
MKKRVLQLFQNEVLRKMFLLKNKWRIQDFTYWGVLWCMHFILIALYQCWPMPGSLCAVCVCVFFFFFCACCKRYIIVLEFHYRSSYLKESKLFDARRQKCFRGLEQRKHSLHSMRQLRGVCSEFWHKHLTFESPSLDVIFVSRDELCSNSSASGLNKEAPACCHDTVAAKWVSMMVF